jgi:hypothetical protein
MTSAPGSGTAVTTRVSTGVVTPGTVTTGVVPNEKTAPVTWVLGVIPAPVIVKLAVWSRNGL